MVVDFAVENFRSIKERQILSFESDTDGKLNDRLLRNSVASKIPLLPSLLVYGGNASGKSNLCRALLVLKIVATQSSTRLNRGDSIPQVVPFRLNPAYRLRPTTFAITLLINEELWQYSITCDSSKIFYESLKRKRNSVKARWSMIFDRQGDEKVKWTGNAPRLTPAFFESVRENGSVLSKAASEDIVAVTPVFDAISNLRVRRMSNQPRDVVAHAIESCESDPSMEKWLARIVSAADVPVDRIQFDTKELAFEQLPEGVKVLLKLQEEELPESVETSNLQFVVRDDDRRPVVFDLADVSDGTIRFLAVILNIHQALLSGSLLVMDEFDASLHPLLAEEVRNLINDPDTNPNGAQFVLVTHNDSLLDSMQLRRDQIIMVTRGRSRGTEWYSLAELDRKPKPDESFQKRYLKGGYGGVPRVGDLRAIFLDIMREKVGS